MRARRCTPSRPSTESHAEALLPARSMPAKRQRCARSPFRVHVLPSACLFSSNIEAPGGEHCVATTPATHHCQPSSPSRPHRPTTDEHGCCWLTTARDEDSTDTWMHGRTAGHTHGRVDDGRTGRTGRGKLTEGRGGRFGHVQGRARREHRRGRAHLCQHGVCHEFLCVTQSPCRKDLLFYRLISP